MNLSIKKVAFILLAFSTLAQAQDETKDSQQSKWNTAKIVALCTTAGTAATVGLLALIKYLHKSKLETLVAHNHMQYVPVNLNDHNITVNQIAHALEPLAWNNYHIVEAVNQLDRKIHTMREAVFTSQQACQYSLFKLPDTLVRALNAEIATLNQLRNDIVQTADYARELQEYRRDLATLAALQHERALRRDELDAMRDVARHQQPQVTVNNNGGR